MEYHRRALEELHTKLKQIEVVEALALELRPDSEGNAGHKDQSERYAQVGLTEAVRDALNIAMAGPKTMKEIGDFIQAHGFRGNREHFRQALSATLARMERAGELTAQKKRGQRKQYLFSYLAVDTTELSARSAVSPSSKPIDSIRAGEEILHHQA